MHEIQVVLHVIINTDVTIYWVIEFYHLPIWKLIFKILSFYNIKSFFNKLAIFQKSCKRI